MENTQSTGMSKGCLISLIVGGFLLVAVIVMIALFVFYLDDMTKWLTSLTVEKSKAALVENPPEGVDTVFYNAVADAFTERLGADDSLRHEEAVFVLQTAQKVIGDDVLDSAEAEDMIDAMITYYPDLESLRPNSTLETDQFIDEDSLSIE